MIKSSEDVLKFIEEHKVCTLFASKNKRHPALWDHVDLPEEKPAGGGWPPRVSAIWRWKNEIPQDYPENVFYGKIPGGDAVLMDMSYLRDIHYPQAYKPVVEFDILTRKIFELIEIEPWFTGDLRKRVTEDYQCTKSRFDTALRKLQISLNIVRSNDPSLENDQWLTFREVHLDIVERYSQN